MTPNFYLADIPVYIVQAPEGKELDYLSSHMELISLLFPSGEWHKIVSVSGLNMRGNEKEIPAILELIERFKSQYENALNNQASPGMGGSRKYTPQAVLIQNYGYGIYSRSYVLEK